MHSQPQIYLNGVLTKVVDVMTRIASLKWNWAGHIARMTDERWTRTIMNCRPPKTRPMGRPPERWTNSIKRVAGTNWQQLEWIVQNGRRKWRPTSSSGYQQARQEEEEEEKLPEWAFSLVLCTKNTK